MQARAANFVPLTPLSFLERSADVFPEKTAVIDGDRQRTWRETDARCRRLASALAARGIGPGDTVAVMAPNVTALFEAHFGVPMIGAVLNAINTRLDADAVAFILDHGEARLLIADEQYAPVVQVALERLERDIPVIGIMSIDNADGNEAGPFGQLDYETLLAEGDPGFAWRMPDDEWDTIALNYTSGTTGDPKGVLYHHRGAYLNALGNALTWQLPSRPVYLWTLPMFHCNGWCFPWTITAVGGTHVCLRGVDPDDILDAIERHAVTHLCGAPIVMNMIAEAATARGLSLARPVRMMTAGAAPPSAVLARMERLGFEVTHVYGLTEVYGPCTVCEWDREWDGLDTDARAALKARQGVRYITQEAFFVADPETLEPVAKDGATMGELMFRGNAVMKGYLKNPAATDAAFAGGCFRTGDLGVVHPDNYVEIRDRSKDIIISGGENISSLEIEDVLYTHPAVLEAAVVARPDDKWGETPCAFVSLKDGATADEDELLDYCRERLAGFKRPKTVVFAALPKTSTGKIRKYALRERAKSL